MLTQNKKLSSEPALSKSFDSILTKSVQTLQDDNANDFDLISKLKRIPKYDTQQKNNVLVNFITKDINRGDKIQKVQAEKTNLPILDVAISLGKYGQNSAFDEIIDKSQFNSIQLKSPRLKQNNPFFQLISLSKSKLLHQKKDTSFIQYICESPKPKKFTNNKQKQKQKSLKNSNIAIKVAVQFPKQLKQLKKQLYELPCIRKNLQKHKTEPTINIKPKAKNIKDLCKQYIVQKKDDFFNQDGNMDLEKCLARALRLRRHKTQQSQGQKLPRIKFNSKHIQSNLSSYRQKYFKSLSSILDQSRFQKTNNLSMAIKFSKGSDISDNPEKFNSKQESLLNSPTKLSKFGKKYRQMDKQKIVRGKYWPYYKKFSPYNDKILQKRVKQMGLNIKQLLQFSQPPSQQTMKIFQAIRILQKQQDDYLQKQSIHQQKNMSQTKYNMKLQNLKESYVKDMKNFINSRRMNSIQRRKRDFQQNQNMTKRIVKLNEKMILKIKAQQENENKQDL